MGKGLIAGLLSGSVVSAVILTSVSLMAPPPASRRAATPVDEAPLATGDTAPTPAPTPAATAGTAPTQPASAETPATETPATETPATETPATETPATEPAATETAAATPEASAPVPSPASGALASPAEKPAEATAAEATAAAPTAAAPSTAIVDVPAGSEFARPKPDGAAALPVPEPAPAASTAALAAAPMPEDIPQLPDAVTAPVPVAGAVAPTAPVLPEASAAPDAGSLPAGDADRAVTAAAPMPAPAPDATPDTAPDTAPVSEPVSEPSAPTPAPAALPKILPVPETPELVRPDATPAETLPPADPLPEATLPPGGGAATDVPPTVMTDAPAAPKGVAGAPKPGFAKTIPGVKVNALPSIGAPVAPDGAVATAPATDDAPDARPIRRFAAAFDNPDKRPVLGVVLIDIGTDAGGAGPETVTALPRPVTVALDPARPGAHDLGAAYLGAGFEIAMQADSLPETGAPSDVEVAFQSLHAVLPQSVVVVTAPSGGVQVQRPTAQQLVAILKDEGIGLVTYRRGLNPARELALAAKLPEVEIVRIADEDHGSQATILRSIARAAFEAGQKGSAVIVLRSYPQSIAALSEFMATEGGAAIIAPVTATMTP